jgi:hypothetical protein
MQEEASPLPKSITFFFNLAVFFTNKLIQKEQKKEHFYYQNHL